MFDQVFSVSQASDLINETIKAAIPAIIIEGEVSGFNVNRGKFVFFDLKDDEALLPCFMMAFALKYPISDGMKIRVLVEPGLTAKGRFSLTVRELQPIGEGSLKKSLELLKKRLNDEGLFAFERKRQLPEFPNKIAVVSSSGAAGWADFSKILSERWGGLKIELADVSVQGLTAPREIVEAIEYFNEQPELADALVVIRGGGSADDLAAFSHEDVVRAVAASRIPTIVGVGHETDESLAELAADKRASTPSHVAQIIVPDKNDVIKNLNQRTVLIKADLDQLVVEADNQISNYKDLASSQIQAWIEKNIVKIESIRRFVDQVNPKTVLNRGYAILRADQKVISSVKNVKIGDSITVELYDGKLGVTVNDKS
jgi:exodeoxyribonuclease VII large subunit